MDLRERLDHELAEPALPAPDLTETLVAGRRVVRRRRTATGVAGLAAATAVGGVAWSLAPVGVSTPVATQPPSQQIPVDEDPANDCHEVPATELNACRGPVVGNRDSSISIYYAPEQGPLRRDPGVRVLETIANPVGIDEFNAAYEVEDNGMRMMLLIGPRGGVSEKAGESADDLATWVEQEKDNIEVIGDDGGKAEPPAYYDTKGVLVVAEDAEIVEQIPNPLGLAGEATSVGLAVEHDGQATWLLLSWSPGSETTSSAPAQQSFATLEDWIEDMVAENQGRDAHVFVEFNSDGTLRPLPGVEIVEQRSGVDLGDFPPESTAVAQVLVGGETWFVAACQCDGSAEYLPVNTPAAGETLDQYIAYHRALNASGEGVR
jgi:hypothetical protein